MYNTKIVRGLEARLAELRMSRMRRDQLVAIRPIGGLRKQTLLIEQRQNPHWFLDQINSGLEVQPEVDVLPLEALALVLLLLQHEHGVVEELLQLLVRVVDAELLERVELEDLESGYVQYADEGRALPLTPVQRLVYALHDPLEHALVDGLGYGLHGELDLLLVLRLGHEIAAHLELGLEERAREVGHVQAEEVADLLSDRVVGQGGLVGLALLLELQVSHLEDAADRAHDGYDVLVAHAHDVHGLDRVVVLLDLVDALYRHVRVGQVVVGLEVVEQVLGAVFGRGAFEQLVEDVECALFFGLADRARLLQQVGLDVGAGDEARLVEVDAYEFALEVIIIMIIIIMMSPCVLK